MELSNMVDLHMRIDSILAKRKVADTQSGIADQTVQSLKLRCKVLRYAVCLMKVFELDLDRVNLGDVAVLLESFLGFGEVLFLLA